MTAWSRRQFIGVSLRSGIGLAAAGLASCRSLEILSGKGGSQMRFGLVTYLWAKDWTLPTLIRNCEITKTYGVELRTQHAHGVEANLTNGERRDVKKRFADSPVILVGLGTNFAFHYTDAQKVRANIEDAKKYVKLSYDVGGTGVKVKPNGLPSDVPVEKTIEQIGTSLNELGKFAADYGQQIRVEVHGRETQQLPIIKRIFDVVDQRNVGACWNCNDQDLAGKGLEYNFNLVKDRLGATVHVRKLNIGSYPYQQLMNLFVRMNYRGWILMEARTHPADRVKALAEQKVIFDRMLAQAQQLV